MIDDKIADPRCLGADIRALGVDTHSQIMTPAPWVSPPDDRVMTARGWEPTPIDWLITPKKRVSSPNDWVTTPKAWVKTPVVRVKLFFCPIEHIL